jgi:hypothetical protein
MMNQLILFHIINKKVSSDYDELFQSSNQTRYWCVYVVGWYPMVRLSLDLGPVCLPPRLYNLD